MERVIRDLSNDWAWKADEDRNVGTLIYRPSNLTIEFNGCDPQPIPSEHVPAVLEALRIAAYDMLEGPHVIEATVSDGCTTYRVSPPVPQSPFVAVATWDRGGLFGSIDWGGISF